MTNNEKLKFDNHYAIQISISEMLKNHGFQEYAPKKGEDALEAFIKIYSVLKLLLEKTDKNHKI